MKKQDKEKVLLQLKRKETDPSITYIDLERETGYSKRQLIRLSNQLKEMDMESIVTHGNTGKKPVTTASDQEVSYLCEFKKPYPSITIAQFRDIFIEDVIENPKMKETVIQYGLKPRSKSWFRQLFIDQGWESPAKKPVRVTGNRTTHPIRKPRPRRGELIQIDGTEFDWFGDGRKYVLHFAVDDAGTEVVAGWFMPTECTRGYAHMMRLILKTMGIPEAIYSDKDAVFRSVKDGAPSQFGYMMEDLHIQMIFANSPQAKGRIERYNGTCQLRLPNDIIRYKIPHDYDILNKWFNEFYIKYLNTKFTFPVVDPNDAYLTVPKEFDYSKIFRGRYIRQINHLSFSFNKILYSPYDENGEIIELENRTKVNVYIDVFTEELYIERYGKRYGCAKVGERMRDDKYLADSQKKLNDLLKQKHKQNM